MKTQLVSLFLLLVFAIPCKAQDTAWQTKSLDKKATDNIEALSKTYGYIRYFYPNKNLKDFDWYKFLIYSIKEVEDEKSAEGLQRKLDALFSPICPNISFSTLQGQNIPASVEINNGFYIQSHSDRDVLSSNNIEYIQKWNNSYPTPDSVYRFQISEDLYIHFPIAVTSLPNNSKELKHLNTEINKIETKMLEGSMALALLGKSRGKTISFLKQYRARVADIIIRRNIIHHFYPYYHEDRLPQKWDKLCYEYYQIAAASTTQYDFYYKICELMHHVKDSHIMVYSSLNIGKVGGYFSTYYPNHKYDLNYSKEKPELLFYENNAPHKVEEVNGFPTKELIRSKMNQISYSTLKSGYSNLDQSKSLLSSFQKDSTIILTLEGQRKLDIQTIATSPLEDEPNATFIEQINDSVIYMNICSSKGSYKKFLEKRDLLEKSRIIVMDMRGYPELFTLSILAHCIESNIGLGNLKAPHIYFPDQIKNEYKDVEKWHIAPATSEQSEQFSKKYKYGKPHKFKLNGSLYFLAKESSISFTETLLDMIKYYKVGTIIGDYTAGSNGDATYVKMPLGSFNMTIFKFQFRDGSQHHGIGVEPDIFIRDIPTDSNLSFLHKIYDRTDLDNSK